jgi:integrase
VRGHLEERGKNVWRAKVYLGRDAEGRRLYTTKTIRGTKRAAENQLNRMLVEASRRTSTSVDPTFSELATKWQATAALDLAPATLAEYERLLEKRLLPRFGAMKIRTLRAVDIDLYYAELHRGTRGAKPLGAQSVQHVHALLRMLLNQAVRWEWIPSNPVSKASPPRVLRRESVIPDLTEVQRILESCEWSDHDFGCFLRLAAVSGARRGELCALRWGDIDLESGWLTIARSLTGGRADQLREKDTKTHAKRRVSLDPETRNSLNVHHRRCEQRARACDTELPPTAFVFSDMPDGSAPWRPGRVTLAFRRLSDRLGVTGVRFHDLRHFAATQLLAAGVPVKTVSARLGHANASTTLNIYAHHLESADEEAAQVLAGLLDGPAGREVAG